MQRENIQQYINQEVNVRGEISAVSKFGICIQDIKVNDEVEVDHSWIQSSNNNFVGRVSRDVIGRQVEFSAVVGQYQKRGGRVDYNFNEGVIVV